MNENPVDKAKRLIRNHETLVSGQGWRELVGQLLVEMANKDADAERYRKLRQMVVALRRDGKVIAELRLSAKHGASDGSFLDEAVDSL